MEKKELYTALAKAQSEFPSIQNNRKGLRGFYADLPHMRRVIDPILNAHGLSLQQHIDTCEGHMVLRNILGHSSGQSEESSAILVLDDNNKSMSKNQVFGSAVSYMSRYTYKSILGLCITDDPDDDDGYGQVADSLTITKEQLETLNGLLKSQPELVAKICKGFGIASLELLPRREYQATYTRIVEILSMKTSP